MKKQAEVTAASLIAMAKAKRAVAKPHRKMSVNPANDAATRFMHLAVAIGHEEDARIFTAEAKRVRRKP